MKLNRLLLTFLFVLTFTANAQAFYIGALAGYRLNNASNDGAVTFKSTPGYQIGALLMFGFSDVLQFRTGAIYTVADTDFSTSAFGLTFSGKQKISYLDIPALVQFSPPGTSLYVFGGLKFGLKSSDSCTVDTLGSCTSSAASTNTRLDLGLGYDLINLGLAKIAIEAEYESALSNFGTSGSSKTNALAFNALAKIGF